MKIKYFSESGYNHLYDSISKHADLYRTSPSYDWIVKEFGGQPYCKESRIDAVLPVLDPKEGDYVNAIQIYEALKDSFSPKQASNPYLWAYMTHCEYWDYTFKRWSKPDMSVDSIKEHYFCGTEEGSRAGFLRNSIARLWWSAYLSYQDDKRGNPYALTQLLFSKEDLRVSIVERNFSMNKNVCIGILSAIQEINDDQNCPDVVENEWRSLCKYINRFGAVTLLDALSANDIMALSKDFILTQRCPKGGK